MGSLLRGTVTRGAGTRFKGAEIFADKKSRGAVTGRRASSSCAPRTGQSGVAGARARRLAGAVTFARLSRLAQTAVDAARRRLPAEVRAVADGVPVCFEPFPNEAILAEGWEPDILGLFVGHEHGGELGDQQPLPPQILLFLENIWDFAEEDEEIFREEVRLTYLHELGHYLGWDEEEVARRGLE